MLRSTLTSVVLAFLLALAPSARAGSRLIYVVNNALDVPTKFDRRTRAAAIAAINAQLRQARPYWYPRGAKLVVARGHLDSGDWRLIFTDKKLEGGEAAGYHSMTFDQSPAAFVSVPSCNGVDGVSMAVSHEVLEMLANPSTFREVRSPSGRRVPLEIIDPVNAYFYRMGSVRVQDWLMPSWFVAHSAGPWDFNRQIAAPFQVGVGGFIEAP